MNKSTSIANYSQKVVNEITVENQVFFENQLLTYKQAAKYLSVSESYLRRLKALGQIALVLIGSRGVRFRVASLNRWTEKREMT